MLERAKFIIGQSKSEVNVMFNPESYSVERNVQYQESSSILKGVGIVQFQKISPKTMTVDLYFDTLNGPPFSLGNMVSNLSDATKLIFFDRKDVTEYTNKFYELVKWDEKEKCTPIVTFLWGSYSFEGVITKISEKFTMFRPDGVPIRANMSISMTEYTQEMSNAMKKSMAAAAATTAVSSSAMSDVTEQQKQLAASAAKALV